MCHFCYGFASKRPFLQALSNKTLSIDVGDHEILSEKVSFRPNERHFMASNIIH